METPKRRFLPGEGVKKVREKYNLLAPELDDDKIRVGHKIQNMTLDEIKSRIPRVIFSGILVSADILYNDHLRGSDIKKRKEAAAVFLEKLGGANFLKNLAALSSGQDKKDQSRPDKVDWGKKEDAE